MIGDGSFFAPNLNFFISFHFFYFPRVRVGNSLNTSVYRDWLKFKQCCTNEWNVKWKALLQRLRKNLYTLSPFLPLSLSFFLSLFHSFSLSLSNYLSLYFYLSIYLFSLSLSLSLSLSISISFALPLSLFHSLYFSHTHSEICTHAYALSLFSSLPWG